MNTVNLLGRLAAAPTTRGSGEHAACVFTLAVPQSYKQPDGTVHADFVDCVAFGALGRTVQQYCDKGRRVAVSGRLSVRSYTTESGERRRSVSVVADCVDFCENAALKPPSASEAPAADDYPFPF